MKNTSNLVVVTTLALFLLIVCILDKFFYKGNKEVIEKFQNFEYKKINETIVPNSFLQKKEEGNLDQCRRLCDDDIYCVGFNRESVNDDTNAECNLVYEIDGCFNDSKKSPNNFELSPGMSDEYLGYDLYLKTQHTENYNLNRMKCVELNQLVSIKHRKYPFDYLYKNSEDKFEMNNIDDNSSDEDKTKAIFKIIKGLAGSGVSFMMVKNGDEHYIVNNVGSEDIKIQQRQPGGQFNKDATFEIDSQYSSKPNLFAVRKAIGNRDLYWKINQTNKKLIIANVNELGLDKSIVLFETVKPLTDNFDYSPVIVPAPSVEIEPEKTNEDLRLEKQEELEKLELEIRESQHQQNLKLMNVMLDVNKFKLMDLSMSDYLRKCNRNSSEELINVSSNNVVNNLGIDNISNTVNNNSNSS